MKSVFIKVQGEQNVDYVNITHVVAVEKVRKGSNLILSTGGTLAIGETPDQFAALAMNDSN
jgi:hypothetical protein